MWFAAGFVAPNSHPLRHLGAGPQRKLPEILLVPVRLFFPSLKYHPALTMMAWFYGARLVKTSSLEFGYCTNTFPLKRKHCTTRKEIASSSSIFQVCLSVTAWGQLQIAVPQAQRLNPRGDLERFHDWLTAAKCPKFVLNQNASKYRICPRYHETQDHRFRHHLILVSFRKIKVDPFLSFLNPSWF